MQQLAAWAAVARSAVRSSRNHGQGDDIRSLKDRIEAMHTRHGEELLDWLKAQRFGRPRIPKPPEAWDQAIGSMASDNRYIVLACCTLLENAVLTVYENAVEQHLAERRASALANRQLREVRAMRDEIMRALRGRKGNTGTVALSALPGSPAMLPLAPAPRGSALPSMPSLDRPGDRPKGGGTLSTRETELAGAKSLRVSADLPGGGD